nr:transposase [Sphingomonas sp. BT553]
MSQPDLFVGIDVAKDELVIHLHPTGTLWRVANSKTGLTTLGCKLTRLAGTACLRIGFEASGGYERKLAILIDRLGLTGFLLDPARVRNFARAERRLAKTDPLGAAVIARCLAALHAELTLYFHDPQAIRLTEHVRSRDLAVAQAVQFGNQLESIADPAMRRLIAARVARLKALALRIEKAIAAVVAASPIWQRATHCCAAHPASVLSSRHACRHECPGLDASPADRSRPLPVLLRSIGKAAQPVGPDDAPAEGRRSDAASILQP